MQDKYLKLIQDDIDTMVGNSTKEKYLDIMWKTFKVIPSRYKERYNKTKNEYLLNTATSSKIIIDRIIDDEVLTSNIKDIMISILDIVLDNVTENVEPCELKMLITSVLWSSNIDIFTDHIDKDSQGKLERVLNINIQEMREISCILYYINDIIEITMPYIGFKLDIMGILVDYMSIKYQELYRRFDINIVDLYDSINLENEGLQNLLLDDVHMKFVSTFITLITFDHSVDYATAYNSAYSSAELYKNYILGKFN